MHLKKYAVLTILTVGISAPALAQQAQRPPLYNTAMPNAQVAGRNAPSYNFDSPSTPSIQPYTFNSGTNNNPYSQQQQGSAQYYLNELAKQEQATRAAQGNYGRPQAPLYGQIPNPAANTGYGNQMYGNQFMPQEQKKPVKRRVVYKDRNNPLTEPTRLFNPDQ